MSHVVLDIRALQTPGSRKRGLGYSLKGWLAAFLKQPYAHRLTLLCDPRFDAPDSDVPLRGEYWQAAPFESYPQIFRLPDGEADQIATRLTEQFLSEQGADLFHNPSPFETAVTVGEPPSTCRSVFTFHDALPVLFPGEYLTGGEAFTESYHAKLQALNRCSRVVAVSQSAATDLQRFTNVSAERIDVIYNAPSPEMFVRPSPKFARASRLLQHIGQPYIFALLGDNPTKNVERLIAAYSVLPTDLKARYKLVITYQMTEQHRATVRAWLDQYQANGRVVFTDWVPRDELRLLYANAELYAHPTLYEGFGMPIVEAMALGAPVIVSDSGPMPEIVGDAGLTVDPYNVRAISDALARALGDEELRADLSQRAIARARHFTWEQAARAMRQTYEKALASPPPIVSVQTIPDSGLIASEAFSPLSALADVADRNYRVKSRAPLVAPLIEWSRRNLTSHLREPYFDPTIERQVAFNHKLTEIIQSLYEYVVGRSYRLMRNPPHGATSIHPSQDIVVEAEKALRPFQVLNGEILAGPLPEYGECLGQEFYSELFALIQRWTPLQTDEALERNVEGILGIQRLARRMEGHYEQLEDFQILALHTDRSLYVLVSQLEQEADVMLRDYRVRSGKPVVGNLIVWIRRNLSSHLREPYTDRIFERQVIFNRLAVTCLRGIRLATIRQLEASIDVLLPDYRVQSDNKLVGPYIVWMRNNLTSHLRAPYIDPIFERQAAFNYAVANALSRLSRHLTDVTLAECGQQNSASIKAEIIAEAHQWRERFMRQPDALAQGLAQLVERMRARAENWL